MLENKVIKRIPGAPSPSPKEKQGYIEDLGKLSQVQLIELLERQNSLLLNTAFIKRLPDKGGKITAFKCRLEAELDRRKEVDNTAALLEKLNINCPVEEIEWTGKYSTGNHDVDDETTEGDDAEKSVLKMLASHGRTSKIERVLKSPEELITQKDLEEINAIKDPYAKALCSKVAEVNSRPLKEVFKPFRTLKDKKDSSPRERPPSRISQSDAQKPEEGQVNIAKGKAGVTEHDEKDDGEVSSTDAVKRVRHWEVTAATPPPPVHDKTVLLDLEESMALEKASVEKTLEARTKQSMMRLAEQLQRGSFTQYREAKEISSDEDEDDDDDEDVKKKEEHEECGDEDEEPERDVAIIYSVVDCNDEAG